VVTRAGAVLRRATVVDGTGAPARVADVEIVGGRIGRIGNLPRTTADVVEVDLDGLVLAPGFIDAHTHYDAQVFWDPELSPSSWHGVTTVIQGNCGFGLAPMRPSDRPAIMETLQLVEQMSLDTLRAGIDWSFETYPEYVAILRRLPKRVNLATYVGHSALRMYVMGAHDAATRAATDDEVERMGRVLTEALASGAVGFSTSRAPSHVGAGGLPVPSRLASPDELVRLMEVTANFGHAVAEITYGPGFDLVATTEIADRLGLHVTWGSLLTGLFGPPGTSLAMLDAVPTDGATIWPQVSCRPITIQFDLRIALRKMAPLPAFKAVLVAPEEERARIYRDLSWRDAARLQAWSSDFEPAYHADTLAHTRVDETEVHRALRGRLLTDIASERGIDAFDVMVDLALEENLRTRFRLERHNTYHDELAALLRDPRTLLGAHDGGAHVSELCDASFPSYLLGHWTRDTGVLTLEQAVWRLTGQPAEVFHLSDRGRIAPGLVADLVAFDPDRIAPTGLERVRDFPADGERLVEDSTGVEHVWVAGEPIRAGGQARSGVFPGQLVSPSR
jgi:N-acyl-D-aspartate/D-glutamate deacylase